MKTSELRIGNYVDTINRSGEIHFPNYNPMKVGNISFFEVELYDIDKSFAESEIPKTTDSNNLCPIELTDDWLMKFGLDYDKKEKETFLIKFSFYIRKDSAENVYDIYENVTGSFIVSIKYVHQLQNIYFALTGEELQMKA